MLKVQFLNFFYFFQQIKICLPFWICCLCLPVHFPKVEILPTFYRWETSAGKSFPCCRIGKWFVQIIGYFWQKHLESCFINFLLLVKSAPTKTPLFMSSLKYFYRFVDCISVQDCSICVSKSTSCGSIVLVSFPYPRPSSRSRAALLLWWREKFCAHTLVI